MKKTQILSAIALAFALGVVAPIAVAENASAAVVEGKTNQQYIDGEIAAIKAKFGNVMVYDANGVTTSYVNGFDYYNGTDGTDGAAGKLDAVQALIDRAKVTAAAGIANATTGVGKVISDRIGDLLTQAEADAITNAQGWGTDYAKTMELASGLRAKFAAIKNDTVHYNTNDVLLAGQSVTRIDAVLDSAKTTIDTAINNSVNRVEAVRLMAVALTGDTTIAKPTTLAEYNAIVAKVEGKLPQMAAYRRVAAAIITANGINIDGLIDRQVKELADALWAAYNGTNADKTVDQIANEANGVNAPATGIAGTAEGTATTVSIVAGLATALTALGAGVVAYRSARRK